MRPATLAVGSTRCCNQSTAAQCPASSGGYGASRKHTQTQGIHCGWPTARQASSPAKHPCTSKCCHDTQRRIPTHPRSHYLRRQWPLCSTLVAPSGASARMGRSSGWRPAFILHHAAPEFGRELRTERRSLAWTLVQCMHAAPAAWRAAALGSHCAPLLSRQVLLSGNKVSS